jgi:hypothetical protein
VPAGYRPGMSTFIQHPVRVVESEVHHLREVERDGQSAETPLIALAAVAAALLPLAALMMVLAFGIAWLVTGAFV